VTILEVQNNQLIQVAISSPVLEEILGYSNYLITSINKLPITKVNIVIKTLYFLK
jgi:hypothetical protein